jgi:hypothetical protein
MIVQVIIRIVEIYIACGIVFALPFVIKGVTGVDEGTYGTKLGFRLIILPGTIIFWPLLLSKWVKTKRND